MVSIFASSVVHHGFDFLWDQIKDYEMCACCFSAKRAAIRSKSKDTGWFEIKLMCPSGVTYLPMDCCFIEKAQ